MSFKNPKKSVRGTGSVMQSKYVRSSLILPSVASKEFRTTKQENIPAEELFFYKFFQQKEKEAETKAKKPRKSDDKEEDEEESDGDDFSYDQLLLDDDAEEDAVDSKEQLEQDLLQDMEEEDEEEPHSEDTFVDASEFQELLEENISDKGKKKLEEWRNKLQSKNKKRKRSTNHKW